MSTASELAAPSISPLRNVPATAFIGPAPIGPCENADDYDNLLMSITSTLRPSDPLEDVWVREIVDVVWESFRLRRVKAAILKLEERYAVSSVISSLRTSLPANELADGWARRDPQAIAKVDDALSVAGLTRDVLTAQAVVLNLDKIERLDRIIMRADARRAMMLRELDKHRQDLALRLRSAIRAAEGAEFEVLAPAEAARTLD